MITLRAFDSDAASRADWAAVNRFRRMRSYEDAPDDPLLDDSEFERQLRHRWPLYENRRWYAWEGDDIVGSGGASLRRAGTDDDGEHAPFVYAWRAVRTSYRRRGIGMRLLAPLLGLMRERDKRVATFETFVSDGHAFLAAIGATLKHRQIESRVSLDSIDWSMLTAWHGVAIPADPPLRWEIHSHRVPRERMEVLNPQFESLMADMPLGEIDRPPIRSELAAWLAWYEDLDRYGGDHSLVMLMDGDAIAAICETAWDARFPDRVE